jgi:ferredoxin
VAGQLVVFTIHPVEGGRPVRVSVDRDRCCSSGQCVGVAPAVFDQSEDDGVVLLLDAEPEQRSHAAVRLAASICPGRAITVHTEE